MADKPLHETSTTQELGLDLPWEQLRNYLATVGLALSASVPPRRFTEGFGNLNFLLEINGEPAVLRRPPPGPLPPGANDMGREFRVLNGLAPTFPLAPRPLHYCADSEIFDAPFLLLEFRPGLIIRDELPEVVRGKEDALGHMLVDTLARLHAVDPEAAGLQDLGRPEGFAERTIEGWFKRASVATDGEAPAAVETLVMWLRDNCVVDCETTLIHNDYKLNNVVLDPQDPTQPVAVLDWDMCTRGDPLFDLATLLSYWSEPQDPPILHELKQMPLTLGGFVSRQQAAEHYARTTGRDLSDFVFHRVLAMFKLGVVFLQLHSRYRRGQAADERYAGFRKVAEGALDFSLDIAAGKVF